MTVPDGQSSVTSDPIFTSGTSITADAFITVTSTGVGWDADAQTITMSSDMTGTFTLTESGVRVSFFKYFWYLNPSFNHTIYCTLQNYRITISYAISGIDLTMAPNCATKSSFVIASNPFNPSNFGVVNIPSCSTSSTTTDKWPNGDYVVTPDVEVAGTAYTATAQSVTVSGSDVTVSFTLTPK